MFKKTKGQVSDETLAEAKTVPLLETLEKLKAARLIDQFEPDPNYAEARKKAGVLVYTVIVDARHAYSIQLLGDSWFDNSIQSEGRGAVALVMHLLKIDVKSAVKIIRQKPEPGDVAYDKTLHDGMKLIRNFKEEQTVAPWVRCLNRPETLARRQPSIDERLASMEERLVRLETMTQDILALLRPLVGNKGA